jgi:hypothetical protein
LLDYFDKQTASVAQAGDSSADNTGTTKPEPGSTKTSQAPGRN